MIGLVIFREFVSVRAVSSSGIFSRRAGTLSMVRFMADLVILLTLPPTPASPCTFNIFVAHEFSPNPLESENFTKLHNDDRYKSHKTVGANEILMRSALDFLPLILSNFPQHANKGSAPMLPSLVLNT